MLLFELFIPCLFHLRWFWLPLTLSRVPNTENIWPLLLETRGEILEVSPPSTVDLALLSLFKLRESKCEVSTATETKTSLRIRKHPTNGLGWFSSSSSFRKTCHSVPELLLNTSFLCQSWSTLGSSWYVKNCLDCRAEPKQIGQELLYSDKKWLMRELLLSPSGRREQPTFALPCEHRLNSYEKKFFLRPENLVELLCAIEPFIMMTHSASNFRNVPPF